MATFTERLNLKKPDPSDFYNIEDFNGNADKIDAKMLRIDDDKASQVEAEAGLNDTKWVSPLNVSQHVTSRIASTSDVQAGTDKTKIITPFTLNEALTPMKQDIKDVSDSNDNLKEGLSTELDVGGIFLVVSAYNKEVKDALPCTGGVYSPVAYPDLFNVIGFEYGTHLPVANKGQVNADSEITCIDKITGNIYVGIDETIYVYNKEGSLIRTGVPYSNGRGIEQMVAYNNVVAAYARNSNYQKYPCVSKDGGLTWTYSSTYTMGNAGSSTCIGICGDFIYFGVNYDSGTYGARYQISTGQWSNTNVWMRTYWYTNAGRSDIAFGNNNGTLYKMNSSGAWTSCGIALYNYAISPNGGVIIDDYLYTINSNKNLIKVNTSGNLVKTYSNVSFNNGLACATKLNNGDIVFFDYDTQTSRKMYALINGEDTLRVLSLASGVVSQSRFTDCCVVDGQFMMISVDSYLYKGNPVLSFQVPNINIDKTIAYIRTKAYGR